MVVGTRSRWVVEVRVIDPSSLRPVAGGRGESEDRCHVCHERVRVARALPSGQRCTLSSFRTLSHWSLGACRSLSGGSQGDYFPSNASELAIGKYITRPGKSPPASLRYP